MLRHTFLLFFLCASTVAPQQTTMVLSTVSSFITTTDKMTTEERISSLRLVATPDYPVAEGQTVHLHCNATSEPAGVNWTWYHVNPSWQVVGWEKDLTLSKPSQSGQYYCHALTETQVIASQSHTVYIVSMRPTVGENLGIAAFALVLLVLIINLAVFSWMGWRRMGDNLSISVTATKASSEPGKSPKGGAQQADTEGDVYMNYTSTNQAYSDLHPVTMNDDNVYSSLS